jgi:DNA-binding GntR family transcriptional regulator
MRPRPPIPGKNTSAIIYQTLRREIVSMQRKPGEPIVEKEISQIFGVSRTPVREAILRLAAENLIEIAPQSGTFVGRIPLDGLSEAMVIRKALESVTVRGAAEKATRSQIAGLQAILERQREAVEADDQDGFYNADEAFHATIAEVAGYQGIWTFIQQVKVQVDRYRHLTLPQPGRMPLLIKEHAAIIEAIGAHHGDKAVAALDAHLGGLEAGLDIFPDLNPNYFFSERGTEPLTEVEK